MSLREDDFRQLHCFCRDVFGKWISDHDASVAQHLATREDLQNERANERKLWERENRERATENHGLQTENETLQGKLIDAEMVRDALRLECRRLESCLSSRDEECRRLASCLNSRDEECKTLLAKLSILPPPALRIADTSAFEDPVGSLSTSSYEALQRMLDEQNAYLGDTLEKYRRAVETQRNNDKCNGNARLLRRAIARKEQLDEDAEKAKKEKEMQQSSLCICCVESLKTHAMYPCGHMQFCGPCADKIVNPGTPQTTYCPICRKDLANKTNNKIFVFVLCI